MNSGTELATSAVIPAKAGIQRLCCPTARKSLDSRFRGNDEQQKIHVK